jgi:bifunctional non-homologous end joining protein LigD
MRVDSVLIDGEGVVCGADGLSDFNRLHSGACDAHVFLYAFDLLECDGQDWRTRTLEERKARLAKMLARVRDGIHLNEHIEDDGELVFEHACRMGLEGIVAKRLDAPYRSGRAKCWIKVKNPKSAAALRIEDATF